MVDYRSAVRRRVDDMCVYSVYNYVFDCFVLHRVSSLRCATSVVFFRLLFQVSQGTFRDVVLDQLHRSGGLLHLAISFLPCC